MRWTMMDLLFVGVGWTDLAITLNRELAPVVRTTSDWD
jgi:hypothetical protein